MRITFQPPLTGNYALNVTCRDREGDASGIIFKSSTHAVIYQKDLQNFGSADSGLTVPRLWSWLGLHGGILIMATNNSNDLRVQNAKCLVNEVLQGNTYLFISKPSVWEEWRREPTHTQQHYQRVLQNLRPDVVS